MRVKYVWDVYLSINVKLKEHKMTTNTLDFYRTNRNFVYQYNKNAMILTNHRQISIFVTIFVNSRNNV